MLEGSQGAGHFPMSPFAEDSPAGQVRHALWLSMPRPFLGCNLVMLAHTQAVRALRGGMQGVKMQTGGSQGEPHERACAASDGKDFVSVHRAAAPQLEIVQAAVTQL